MQEYFPPKTIAALETWMKENCYNFLSYSINGNIISEGHGIEKTGDRYVWYYTERGEQNIIKSFTTESEAVEYAFNEIKADKWAKTHLTGFTTSMEEKIELENILKEMGVEYFQDKIHYYGLERPAYRTFVLGCGVLKAAHLKDKYYNRI